MTALGKRFAPGTVIPEHVHDRAQITYAVCGTIRVTAGGSLWMLPPSHALWIPAGIAHEIRMVGAVEMTTLYVQPHYAPSERRGCEVFFVSPLLRELIVRALELPALYDENAMPGRVMQLILDEMALLPAQPLGLPMPRDGRLQRLCAAVLDDVSARVPISDVAARVGLSERSVFRLFPRETGLTFNRWHQQAKLLKAFEFFDEGRSVTRVALDLGYSSPSAFSKMFRKVLGTNPALRLSVSSTASAHGGH